MNKYRQNLMNSSTYTCSGYCYQQAVQNESGRSMIEMLGVLAVIGVLSVGGIAGYTMAMNKHRANELLNEASMRAMTATAQMAQGRAAGDISFAEFGSSNLGYGTFGASALAVPGETSKFGIQVSNVDKAVCQNLVNMTGGQVVMAKAATPGTAMTAADCSDDKEQNVLAFIYDSGTAVAENVPPSPPFSTNPNEWEPGNDGDVRCVGDKQYVSFSGEWNYWVEDCPYGCKSTWDGCADEPKKAPGDTYCSGGRLYQYRNFSKYKPYGNFFGYMGSCSCANGCNSDGTACLGKTSGDYYRGSDGAWYEYVKDNIGCNFLDDITHEPISLDAGGSYQKTNWDPSSCFWENNYNVPNGYRDCAYQNGKHYLQTCNNGELELTTECPNYCMSGACY